MPASHPSKLLLRLFLSRNAAVAVASPRFWWGGGHYRHHHVVVRPPIPLDLRGRRSFSSSSSSSGHALRELFQRLASGEVTVDEAEGHMKMLGSDFERLGDYAKLDHDRAKRTGVPEVVFGQGKTAPQIAAILQNMYRDQRRQISKGEQASVVIVTRLTEVKYSEVCQVLKGLLSEQEAPADQKEEVTALLDQLDYNPVARIASVAPPAQPGNKVLGSVAVLCAGTADLSVAEEAAVVAELSRCQVHRAYDVGVAGIHRLFRSLQTLRDVQVVMCVAGMDGALPTVVAGLVTAPVIAVPTSVGYGVGKDGMAPLMTMLNGCAPGLAVVNIDNGFGAATMAVKIVKAIERGGRGHK